jgi:hypothetical protein
VKEPRVEIIPAVPSSEFPVPAIIAGAGDKASEHFLEFFAGAVAALNSKDDVGHLHAGPESAKARGAEQSGRHDQAKTKLYRRCTASF